MLDPLSVTVLGRGYFDAISVWESEIEVRGWMLLVDQPFDAFELYLNGDRTEISNQQELRNDLAAVFPAIDHAASCSEGFSTCTTTSSGGSATSRISS